MKLALVPEGNDFAVYEDAAWRAEKAKAKKLAMLNRNMADFTIEPVAGAKGLPIGAFQTINDALIALREAGFEFEKYEN